MVDVTSAAFKVAIHTLFFLKLLYVDDSIEVASPGEIVTCFPSFLIPCGLVGLNKVYATVLSTPGLQWIINV